MEIKEIIAIKNVIDQFGTTKSENILMEWIVNENASTTLHSDDMLLIGGYTKWTLITEANYKSIKMFLNYIMFEYEKYKKKKKLFNLDLER